MSSPSVPGEMGCFCIPQTHFPRGRSHSDQLPGKGFPKMVSFKASILTRGIAASHLPPQISPSTIFDASSFHPLLNIRDSSPCPLPYHAPRFAYLLCFPSLPSMLIPPFCPCLGALPHSLPHGLPHPAPPGQLLLLLLLARCSLVWREAINSSISSALIDTVWTEDGKINKGNSFGARLRAAATFLMLNNSGFSTQVCRLCTDWHWGRRGGKR